MNKRLLASLTSNVWIGKVRQLQLIAYLSFVLNALLIICLFLIMIAK
ncbi:hypothetical protein IGK74_001130 [Enterococcus sp. AZ150]